MKSEKTDRRIKYTKMVLRQSLLELMADKPLSKITIKEICDLADVNRGTFYSHYSDQYDLLNQIQNELDAEIKSTLGKKLSNASSVTKIITEIFHCIAAQSSLCKILFSEYGDTEFLKKIMYNAHGQYMDEWQTKLKQTDIKQLDRLYTFAANGIAAVTQEWLQDGMKESPQEIALFIERAISYGLSSFVDGI